MLNPFRRNGLAPRPRTFRPGLEALERRDCPSAGLQPGQQLWYLLNTSPVTAPRGAATPATEMPGGGGGGGGGGSGGGGGTGSNPVITLLYTHNAKTSITLTGSVTDNSASVAGLTVTFTGEVTGTAVTDANGNFTLTANAAGLGGVSASTVDSLQHASNTATVNITDNTPAINNFSYTQGSLNSFTFTGTTSAASPGGLMVSFGGIPSLGGQTATVGSDGSFSLNVVLNSNGSDNGTATAQLTDWWGLQSNVATTYVTV